jgi:hypothetical protein
VPAAFEVRSVFGLTLAFGDHVNLHAARFTAIMLTFVRPLSMRRVQMVFMLGMAALRLLTSHQSVLRRKEVANLRLNESANRANQVPTAWISVEASASDLSGPPVDG